jgi:hypothetical protein
MRARLLPSSAKASSKHGEGRDPEVVGAWDQDDRTGAVTAVGRLPMAKLLAVHRPNAAMGDVMRAQVGGRPKHDARQIQDRCDPYSPDLTRLFRKAEGEAG